MSSKEFSLVRGKSIASPVKFENLAEAIEFLVISFCEVWVLHDCPDSVRHKCWILAIEQIEAYGKRLNNRRKLWRCQIGILFLRLLLVFALFIDQEVCYEVFSSSLQFSIDPTVEFLITLLHGFRGQNYSRLNLLFLSYKPLF